MTRFLSYAKIKSNLTRYLVEAVLMYNTNSEKLVITSASGQTKYKLDTLHQENNHEEADTLMMCTQSMGTWIRADYGDTSLSVHHS